MQYGQYGVKFPVMGSDCLSSDFGIGFVTLVNLFKCTEHGFAICEIEIILQRMLLASYRNNML